MTRATCPTWWHPPAQILTFGDLRIGLIHGHQVSARQAAALRSTAAPPAALQQLMGLACTRALCAASQIIPYGNQAALSRLQRQLAVDILVTGHTHEHKVRAPCQIRGASRTCCVWPAQCRGAPARGPRAAWALTEARCSCRGRVRSSRGQTRGFRSTWARRRAPTAPRSKRWCPALCCWTWTGLRCAAFRRRAARPHLAAREQQEARGLQHRCRSVRWPRCPDWCAHRVVLRAGHGVRVPAEGWQGQGGPVRLHQAQRGARRRCMMRRPRSRPAAARCIRETTTTRPTPRTLAPLHARTAKDNCTICRDAQGARAPKRHSGGTSPGRVPPPLTPPLAPLPPTPPGPLSSSRILAL